MCQVPNGTNGRPRGAEQGTALLTTTSSAVFGPDPGLTSRGRGTPDRRKKLVVAPSIVRATRLLACASLNHSRAVPAACPPPEHVRRALSVICSSPPSGNATGGTYGGTKRSGIVLRRALLKPLPPADTLSSWPRAISCPPTDACAKRSSRRPTSSLFFSPTQSAATSGLRSPSKLRTGPGPTWRIRRLPVSPTTSSALRVAATPRGPLSSV